MERSVLRIICAPSSAMRVAAVIGSLGIAAAAHAQVPQYWFNVVPAPAGALATACGAGQNINDANQISGSVIPAAGARTASFWPNAFVPPALLAGLGGRYAFAPWIDNNGVMAGYATTPGDLNVFGVFWANRAALPTVLPPSPGNANSAVAGITRGLAAAHFSGASFAAFVLTPPAVLEPDLTFAPVAATQWTLAGAPVPVNLPGASNATGINDPLEAVGVNVVGVDWHAPFGPAAVPLACPGAVSPPANINNPGAVTATLANGNAAICPPAALAWIVLNGGAVGAGAGIPRRLNNAGWVVSSSNAVGPLLWIPNGAGVYPAVPANLNALLPPALVNAGWTFNVAGDYSINNNNWIAGNIVNAAAGLTQCVVLSTALPGQNTSAGTNVSVTPTDPTSGAQPATITFPTASVGGVTTVTSNPAGVTPPASIIPCAPPIVLSIATTATFTPPATVCVNPAALASSCPANSQVWEQVNGTWQALPVPANATVGDICGSANSLGSFTVGAPPSAISNSGEVPLPPWSLALLSLGLLGGMWRATATFRAR